MWDEGYGWLLLHMYAVLYLLTDSTVWAVVINYECRCGRCERSIILNGLLDIGHYCLWEYVFKKWLNVQNVISLFSLRHTHSHTHTMLSP